MYQYENFLLHIIGSLWSNVIPILLILFVLYIFTVKTFIISHWHHTFDNLQFSTQDFYTATEKGIYERDIPKSFKERVTHLEYPVFGARREYLRITRGEYTFDVCAAPFGTGFYVSWWLVTRATRFELFFRKLPIFRYFFETRTYHQVDVEQMFCDLVHFSVLEAADIMTDTKGVRRLSEPERMIHNSPKALL